MKKLLAALLLAAGLILVPLSASAQAAGAGFQVLSFDIGYAPSWDLNATSGQASFVSPSYFALNVRVANNLSVGFETLSGGTTTTIDNYLTVKYNFLPALRGTVAFGQTRYFAAAPATAADPAIGLGFEAIPFSRTVAGSVSTEFKLAFQYIATTADLKNSGLVFALAFGVGF
jgi:hypothetical protein